MKKSVVISICILAVIVSGLCVWKYIDYQIYYSRHFVDNTYINGVDCSGLNVGEAQEKLTEEWNKKEFIIEEDGKEIGVLSTSGFTYKIKDNLSELMTQVLTKPVINALITPRLDFDIDMIPSQVSASFKKEFQNLDFLDQEDYIKTRDAYVDMSDNDFEIVREVYGTGLDQDLLMSAILKHIKKNDFVLDYNEEDFYKMPKLTADSKKIKQRQKYCKKYLSAEITYEFGSKSETISPEWLDRIIEVKNKKITINDKELHKYIEDLSADYNTVGITRYFKGYSVSGGTYGYIINKEDEFTKLSNEIKSGKDVTREPIYAQEAWGPYDNDIGGTYVDVNLSAQVMSYYRDNNKVLGNKIVTGNIKMGSPTPSGTYMISYKQRDRTLRGEDYDGTEYESKVAYWMPFYGGYGFHDAPWRDKFGGSIYKKNGSHGCVNMPPGAAASLYGMIAAGTPVVVHY